MLCARNAPTLVLLVVLAAGAHAQSGAQAGPGELESVPEPPPIPESVESGEAIEPEVTIVPGERGTVEEYRIGGQLYAIKVTPVRGKPYFLVDTDGDGRIDYRRNELGPDFLIPSWVILRW